MSDRSWIVPWEVDDKTLLLDRDHGTITISTGFANRFSFIYGDPRKMAEVLHEIAGALLQCQDVSYDDNNNPVQCKKPGTVRIAYSTGDGTYMPARTLCDDHCPWHKMGLVHESLRPH